MPVKKKSFDAENYKPKAITIKKIKAYSKKHGDERAAGYHDALKDMANNIEGLFYKSSMGEFYYYNSPNVVHRRLHEFKQETDILLNEIEKAEIIPTKQPKGDKLSPIE